MPKTSSVVAQKAETAKGGPLAYAQSAQAPQPGCCAYVPASHSVQLASPANAAYVPTEQLSHTSARVPLYCPMTHTLQFML